MKGSLITFVTVLAFTTCASAQSGVQILFNGTGPNLAGQSHEVYLYESHPEFINGVYQANFEVVNNTGSDKQWRITRRKLVVPTNWVDQLSWPPLCSTSIEEYYSTPNTVSYPAPIIVDGTSTTIYDEAAVLQAYVTPDETSAGFAHYRYYINEDGVYIDSVDLKINFVLATIEIKHAPQIAIGPNPASEIVKISGLSADSYKLKIIDVLGNTVHQETIMTEARTINVGDYKNGVYFVILETAGEKAVTKRLVVRH